MTETRTLEDGRAWLLQRLEKGIHPVDEVDPEVAREAIEGLGGLDPESWTSAWGAAAERFAASAEAATDPAAEREAWLDAYRFAFIARYPTLNHPLKHEWYDRTRDYFVRARTLDDPPLQVVTRAVRRPRGRGRPGRLLHRPAGRSRAAAGRDDLGRDRHLEGGDAQPRRVLPRARLRDAARRHARDRPVARARGQRRRAAVDAGVRLARVAGRPRRHPRRDARRLVRRLLGDEARLHA